MSINVPEAPRRGPQPIAAWILGVLSALHGAAAFVFVAGGRTPANELEGFVMGTTAAVLLVGAILSYGLVRLRAELRNSTHPH
ncbi:MAG TPA: hypothetical protein VLK28_03725 [Methylomirabilota bacterium]|nr:hypothetical protein [Methylomirabilota bacterium]